MTYKKLTPQKFKSFVEHELEELQAIDTVYIDINDLTAIADGLWIATGRSKRHVQAIAENLMDKLKEHGMPALSMTGYENADWILIDCDQYLIHIMQAPTRALYQLEELWQKAQEKRQKRDNE